MSRLGPLLRGLLARRGLTTMTLLVAVIAAAAAAAGPTFYNAAQRSILTDGLHQAETVEQGIEVSEQGGVGGLAGLDASTEQALKASSGAALFPTTVRGQEVGFSPAPSQITHIAWRDRVCGHLRIRTGHCPRAAGEAVVSRALAHLDHLTVGDRLHSSFAKRVVGIYEPRSPQDRYWFNRGYFPQEGLSLGVGENTPVDAVFTAPASFRQAEPHAQATSMVDVLLDLDAVTPDNAAHVRDAVSHVSKKIAFSGGSTLTGVETVLDRSRASWRALAVPTVLVTLQLLVLVWLLLFLIITDAAEARGPEIALAKLRGLRRLQTLRFGLAEPVTVLLVALPVGVALGWLSTVVLSGAVLRDGTPVAVGPLTVLAAAFAVSGGLVAAVLAGRRTLVRPVLAQWRRAGRAQTQRGWVLDVAVLVATGAGLVELYTSGAIGAAQTHIPALLVPGLVGLAVAVLASRVLPWGCRALFRLSRHRGGIGGYLAVREVARRPAGMRNLTVLAAALALATFSLAAWNVSRSNIHDVAATETGAAAVVEVVPRQGEDLATTVDRLDPSGSRAMAVDRYVDFGNQGRQTLGVESDRYANIAYWRADFSDTSPARLARGLHPPAPAPVTFEGDRIRLTLRGVHLSAPQSLHMNVKTPTSSAPTPVDLGRLSAGRHRYTAPLPPCPCTLRDLTLESPSGQLSAVGGRLVLARVQTRTHTGWSTVDAGLRSGHLWSWSGGSSAGATGGAATSPNGLLLDFNVPLAVQPGWSAYGRPFPLPALVTGNIAAQRRDPHLEVAGLDGRQVAVRPLATVPVPGSPEDGTVLDRTYAHRAAFSTRFLVTHEVWLAPVAVARFPHRLRAAGVQVLDIHTADHAATVLQQQGPALALTLFLADAAAAAVLAALGAAAGLYLTGRRRRYELTALIATGARRASLWWGLLLEQALTLGLAVVAGVGAGLGAAHLALPAVPEFVERPAQPALLYAPDAGALLVPLVAVVAGLAVVALLSTLALVSGTRAEQLREEPG